MKSVRKCERMKSLRDEIRALARVKRYVGFFLLYYLLFNRAINDRPYSRKTMKSDFVVYRLDILRFA